MDSLSIKFTNRTAKPALNVRRYKERAIYIVPNAVQKSEVPAKNAVRHLIVTIGIVGYAEKRKRKVNNSWYPYPGHSMIEKVPVDSIHSCNTQCFLV